MKDAQKHIKSIIEFIGENPDREGLLKTPERSVNAFKFLTQGYSQDIHKIVKGALFTESYDEMVVVKNIEFYSLCEHHLLPFYGHCHVGYIPSGKVIGLSKIPRIVNVFSRRLQLQERLTAQIGKALEEILEPKGVAVVIEAHHLCMMMRGVEKQNSLTTTSSMIGCYREIETRNEFLSLVK